MGHELLVLPIEASIVQFQGILIHLQTQDRFWNGVDPRPGFTTVKGMKSDGENFRFASQNILDVDYVMRQVHLRSINKCGIGGVS